MNVRPPSIFQTREEKDPLAAALEHEVMAEKAGTHGRLLARLERALDALRAHDRETDPVAGNEIRSTLVQTAGEALWFLVIQRELMRLPGTARLMKDLDIPADVRLAMGVRRTRL